MVRRLIEGTGSRLDESGIAFYQRLLEAPAHVNGVLAMMASWRLDSLARRLPQLCGPVFMQVGTNDRAVPGVLARQACALMPHAELISLAGLGHLAHEEDPAGACAQILEWVNQGRR
jgi:magnesium chelatase accessory protein